ncbi:MAG: hypothetical protein ABF812_14655, partial [Gluconobacter cerinus]|uniref:hypothetical protein n=1 Tax=Gluconobacter cerinus TaxID=38307 RepID=UPI0039E7C907
GRMVVGVMGNFPLIPVIRHPRRSHPLPLITASHTGSHATAEDTLPLIPEYGALSPTRNYDRNGGNVDYWERMTESSHTLCC